MGQHAVVAQVAGGETAVDQIVYLNGEYVPLADAKIPVLDRGFIFGDGVYEVIPAYRRVLFRLEEHLARLEHSLRSIRIASPHDPAAWRTLLETVVARNPWDDQSVYLQVTRGVAPRTQEFPKGEVRPTVFIMSNPLKMPTPEQRASGVAVVTRDDYRWRRCDIKSVSLLANCLLRQEAEDAGAIETVLIRDGNVKEASTCNVFLVKDGVILAPPKDNLILHGITFDLALDLAREAELPLQTREVKRAELFTADEVWLSSSAREVLPVTTVDGKRVGTGKPGPVYARMHQLFQDYKARTRPKAHA
jgi:D-alanine transaminase